MKDLNELEALRGKIFKVNSHSYFLSKSGCAYVASISATSGKLHIFEINPELVDTKDGIHSVQNPTASQYNNALLNYIVEDNATNRFKRGLYNLSVAELRNEFALKMMDVERNKAKSEDLIRFFALDKEDILVKKLTEKVVAVNQPEKSF